MFNDEYMIALDKFKTVNPSFFYAKISVNNEKVPKYVQKQCQEILNDFSRQDDEDFKYFFDIDQARKINNLLKCVNFASGIKVGTPVHSGLAQFQWFFIINTLCWKHKDNHEKRKYEKSVLLIGRKSGKSFLVGLIFILLMLTEPKFSELYSVAPDRELSSIVKKEAEQLISVSPALRNKFKPKRDRIECLLTSSMFMPLALSKNRMDGRKANVFVADEVGALPTRQALDSMQSSQMNMLNRLGILISTAYNTEMNVMTEEIEYCEKVLDGLVEDETCFSLLYMPDDKENWITDLAIYQANPLALEIKENFEYLLKQRKEALEKPSALANFKTKHLNIFINGDESEVYIPLDDFKKCKIPKYDWKGKEVYLGLDLSQTTDNTSLAMVTYDLELEKYVCKVWAFAPEDGINQKIKLEKVDYHSMKDQGFIFYCGDNVIDYGFIEDFIMNLENNYGVHIKNIGYDRYNCISTANKLVNNGIPCEEVLQHSKALHPATKLLKEKVLLGEFQYEMNTLLEINISNARENLDTNLNGYVTKKHSRGRVDMVVALINAMYLWNKEMVDGSIYETDYRDDGFIIL